MIEMLLVPLPRRGFAAQWQREATGMNRFGHQCEGNNGLCVVPVASAVEVPIVSHHGSSTVTVCSSHMLGQVRGVSRQPVGSVFSSVLLSIRRESVHCSQSTEQPLRAARDSSLLFLFKSRFQSWLMFAQKYVIADFLLINPPSTQTTRPAHCYYLSAWG